MKDEWGGGIYKIKMLIDVRSYELLSTNVITSKANPLTTTGRN